MGGQINGSKGGELFFVVNDWDYFRGEVQFNSIQFNTLYFQIQTIKQNNKQ